MNQWPKISLGEVLHKSEDWIQLHPNRTYKEVTVRLWGKGVTLRKEVAGAEIASAKRLQVHANQFIISRIDARNGASGLIPEELEGAVVSNDFPVFTPISNLLDPHYLGWLSKTKGFVELCKAASEGTTNRVRLKEERFLETQITFPPLPEQRRLVERIDELAAKIGEAKNLRNRLTDESAAFMKATMRAVFTELPESEATLHSVCSAIIDCLHSNPIYADDGIPTVRSPDVGWGQLLLGTARKTNEAEYRRRTSRGEPAPGDIVVVREGGGTGKAGMVEEGQQFSLGQRVMMFRPNQDKVEPKFLLYQWLSPLIFDDQIIGRMKGSASPHLNIGAAREFKLRVPSLERQRKVVSYLDQFRERFDRVEQHKLATVAELEAMIPAILNRAFRGEL